jgi:hypothetical protein
MKMKTYRLVSLAIGCVAFAFAACSDLDLNESQYHSKEYQFSDFSQVKEVMTNVYGYLQSGFASFQECASDDAVYADSPDVCKSYYDGSWSANEVVDDQWSHYYAAIRAANYLLENCPEDFDIARWDERYRIYLAQLKNYPYEARALRAWFHMELLKRYRRIVIADKTYSVSEVNSLEPVEYDKAVEWIANELEDCAKYLPDSYSDTYYSEIGRVTKGFALAARARLLLYAASPLNNPGGDASEYAKAAEAALDFIDANRKSLQYGVVRQQFNAEAKDLIFGIREAASNNFESNNFPAGYEGGNSGICPSLNLVEAFDMADGTPFDFDANKEALLDASKRDPRLARDILSNGDSFKGSVIESYTGGNNGLPKENASPTSFYLRKFIQEATSLTTGNVNSYPHIYPLLRVQEVYLNYAEALFEGTKNPDFTGVFHGVRYVLSPRSAVNLIRAAYSMPEIPSDLPVDQFRMRLRNERRVELCFEGHRFWDLRRWKIGESTKEIYGITITKIGDQDYSVVRNLVQNRYWNDKMNWYPISEVELHKNGNLVQNDGWE